MKTRSFKVLREHVLPKIKEIFANNRRKLPQEPFKKHFWHYYLKEQENLEVKVAWKKLPRTKPRVSSRDDSDSSFISDMMDKSEINDDQNKSIIFEEDKVNNKGNVLFEEVKEVDIGEEWCDLIDDFHGFKKLIPVEKFFKEDSLIEEDEGIYKEEEIEAPYVNFDDDLINLLDKSCCNIQFEVIS